MGSRFELTAPDDIYYDYCLWEYRPVASPSGKLRSASLLYDFFQVAGWNERAYEYVNALREGIGLHHTVWGIQQSGERLKCELYFYDYRRRNRTRSVSKILESSLAFFSCDVPVEETIDYFMFSLDIDPELLAGRRKLDEIHLYIGNPGSLVSSGICYSVTKKDTRLENFYFFFDAKRSKAEIGQKIRNSAFLAGPAPDLKPILWRELIDCGVIVVANKPRCDSVYFSRITVDQLLFFMKRMQYPQAHVAFLEKNKSRFDHLLYDMGFDYRMEENKLVILKSGYYGCF